MKTHSFRRLAAHLLLPFFVAAIPSPLRAAEPTSSASKLPEKPNIIFILADDLGIGNVSCYGADNFKTSNIDGLAKTGMRFERCYAAPLCGPSRACLMTGRYAYHTGMTSNDSGPLLKPDIETMIPKVLKTAGYVTGMCGKWSQLPLQPSDWGFDEYLRFQGSGQYWNTQPKAKTYTVNGKEVPLLDKQYLPDKMHDFVVDFVNRHKDERFYMYYSMSHVHEDILPTPDSAPDSMNLYNDNVVYMDKLVGKLLAELDRLHLRDKTLIVFAGDNGTTHTYTPVSTVHGRVLSGYKTTMLEGGALVPCIASWPGKIQPETVTKSLLNITDFFPTLAEVGGARLPAGLVIDGQGIARQLLGKESIWPRNWIFVELGRHWYDRDADWKMDEASQLFDMRDAPFAEPTVPLESTDAAAIAARKHLQEVLNQLNPAGGIMDKGDGSGSHAKTPEKKEKKKAQNAEREARRTGGAQAAEAIDSQNANAPDQ